MARLHPEPFIKCPGGKRKLAARIVERMPMITRYVEPFLGGGAVFFHLAGEGLLTDSELVVLGDADEPLITLYEEVKADPKGLWARAHVLSASITDAASYNRERDLWNAGNCTAERQLALRFAAYNGLWRMSRAGRMNSPWCKAPGPRLPPQERFIQAAWALQHVRLVARDFRAYDAARWQSEPLMRPGTVVYLDSPYLGGWVAYRAEGWSRKDAQDYVGLAARWSRQGAHVLMSHSDTPEFRLLLQEAWPEAALAVLDVARPINSRGNGRGPVSELLASSPV